MIATVLQRLFVVMIHYLYLHLSQKQQNQEYEKHLVLLSVLLLQAAAVSVFAKKKVLPEYIDLGLSVKWCTCDVGTATPLDEGYLICW